MKLSSFCSVVLISGMRIWSTDDLLSPEITDGTYCLCPPLWVHVFVKSTWPSSIRTQAASIAYIELPVHKKKVWHRRNRRSKKKLRKQQNLLTEVIVPPAIKQNLLSESDIENEIVVVDGGDDGNPSTHPTDGIKSKQKNPQSRKLWSSARRLIWIYQFLTA